jgi:hypothetical protein
MMKTRILDKNELLSKPKLRALVNTDIHEINHLKETDIICLWSFFKFLCTDMGGMTFVTPNDSIVYYHRRILKTRWNIPIMTLRDVARKTK